MNAAEKIAHAAERKAFETMLDSLIRKSQKKDVCTVANDFVNMVQKIHSSVWTPETVEMLHQILPIRQQVVRVPLPWTNCTNNIVRYWQTNL